MVSSGSSFCDSRLEKGLIQLSREIFDSGVGNDMECLAKLAHDRFPNLTLPLSLLTLSPLLSSPLLCSHY